MKTVELISLIRDLLICVALWMWVYKHWTEFEQTDGKFWTFLFLIPIGAVLWFFYAAGILIL
ncbi:MAG: hypothetical protein CMK59_09970 [Proteobacteria bacterium]|nr:hypothetical protein [Pseudomonadota bacterium]